MAEADESEVADCKAAKASAGDVVCKIGGARRTVGKVASASDGAGKKEGAGAEVAEMPSDVLDDEDVVKGPGAGRADAGETEEDTCAAAAAGILPAEGVPGWKLAAGTAEAGGRGGDMRP